MTRLSEQQAHAMIRAGFKHGFRGYPVLFSDNGAVTVVEEAEARLTVWVFEPNGSVLMRDYVRDGGLPSHISSVL